MSAKAALIAVMMLALTMTSCWPFPKAKPATPPPVKAAQAPPVPAQVKPAPQPQLEPPPTLPASEGQQTIVLPQTEDKPLPPPPAKKRPSPVGPPATAQVEPETPVPSPPQQLRPILSAEQRLSLERAIAQHVSRAQSVLVSLGRRTLTADQAATVKQIQTFLQQSEEARPTDLLRANNLAERAEILAKDLAGRVR